MNFNSVLFVSLVLLIIGSVQCNDANISDFPYQVSLRRGGSHFCSAAILSNEWIVTAASCIMRTPPFQVIEENVSYGEIISNSDNLVYSSCWS